MLKRARRSRDDVKTSFYLPRATLRAMKARAARDSVSLRTLLLEAIARYLAEEGKR